jgi:hypothetical protein
LEPFVGFGSASAHFQVYAFGKFLLPCSLLASKL